VIVPGPVALRRSRRHHARGRSNPGSSAPCKCSLAMLELTRCSGASCKTGRSIVSGSYAHLAAQSRRSTRKSDARAKSGPPVCFVDRGAKPWPLSRARRARTRLVSGLEKGSGRDACRRPAKAAIEPNSTHRHTWRSSDGDRAVAVPSKLPPAAITLRLMCGRTVTALVNVAARPWLQSDRPRRQFHSPVIRRVVAELPSYARAQLMPGPLGQYLMPCRR